jgi:LEA14-like dessication related protein
MFRLLTCHPRLKTQTPSSAFFCPCRKRIPAGISVLVLLLTAQAFGFEQKKPTLRLKGVSIKSIDWSSQTAETELSIAIDNPGPALKVKDLTYRLKLNEKQAAEGKYAKAIEVPAESALTFDLPCTVDLSALPGVAWAVITGGFDVHYELATEFTVPLFASLSPRVKTSIVGDLSLAQTVTGWSARIKERIASK